MQRRGFLLLAAQLVTAAGAQQPDRSGQLHGILRVFSALATALSGGDPFDFMAEFDKAMPEYDQLRADVIGLLEQNEVLASLDFKSAEATDTTATVKVNWLLEIRSRQPAGPVTKRNATVDCKLKKTRKKWKIVEMKPLNLLAPPR